MNKPLAILKKSLKRLFVEGRLSKIEPLFFSRGFDVYQRYSKTVAFVRSCARLSSLSVLEVGAGGLGIAGWLDDSPGLSVTLLDIDVNRLKKVKKWSSRCEYLTADGCQLPFVDNSFDVVVSLATLEHIDRRRRFKFAEELKRVAKKWVILYVPIAPVAIIGDEKFAKTYRRIFRKENRPTKEHMCLKQPSLKELRVLFPDCKLELFQNLVVWYVTMILARFQIIGWLSGLLYIMLLSRLDRKPPFYGCMVFWNKLSREEECLQI